MTTDTKKQPKRLVEDSLRAKHSHIVRGSLRYDAAANKQKVTIWTRDEHGIFDGDSREIATSDLHQTFWTQATKDRMDRAKRNAKARTKRADRRNDAEIFVVLDDEAICNGPTGLEQLDALLA